MDEKFIEQKAGNSGLGNYALYIQGEKYPRIVFINKTEDYVIKAAKILSTTPVITAVLNPNAKENTIGAEVENYFFAKDLVVKKIQTEEEALRLKQGILDNRLLKKKPQSQQIQKPTINLQPSLQFRKPMPMQNKPQNQQPKFQPKPQQPQQNSQPRQNPPKFHAKQIVQMAIQKVQQKPQQKPVQQKNQQKKPMQKPQQKFQPKQQPNQKPQQQKLNLQNSRSIQDEIRRMIQSELAKQKTKKTY